MILAQERAADDAVLAGGCTAADYANLLAWVACEERELALVSMARKSSLGARVERLLDGSQRRGGPNRVWSVAIGAIVLGCASVLSLARLRAQEAVPREPTVVPATAAKAEEPDTWMRTYRDTFRLEKSFADAFPGSADEALATLRAQLAARLVALPVDARLELRPDKGSLTMETADPRDAARGGLANFLRSSGWWKQTTAGLEARAKLLEASLAPLRQEIEKHRQRVKDAYVAMAKLREAGRIIDPDPESSQSRITTEAGDVGDFEKKQQAQAQTVGRAKAQFERVSKMQPEEMREILRVLNVEDDAVVKVVSDWENAVSKEAILASSRVGEDDVRRKGIRAQKEALHAVLAEVHGRIREGANAKLEADTVQLQEIEKQLASARETVVEEKTKLNSYVDAKAVYLPAKRILEAMQLKLSTVILESGLDW